MTDTKMTPMAILKIETERWRELEGVDNSETLRSLKIKHSSAGARLTDEAILFFLADMAAQPRAKIIGYKSSPEAQALLAGATDPDDALLSVADAPATVPATVPQEPEAKSEPQRSELHQAARDYAAQGRKIFPCREGLKTPATRHGFKDATNDVAMIDAHWSEHPNDNIAFEPETEGLAIIEADTYKPEFNEAALTALDLPATYEVQSARGGIHKYYRGSAPPSASKLGPAIDCRGRGGYVLLPPSIFEGKRYRVLNDRPIAPLPPEIAAKLAPKAEPAKAPDGIEIDLPANIEKAQQRLRDLVKDGRVAIEGRGGDDFTYKVTCELVRDLALSEEKALELLETEFNPHCQPPWAREELIAKVNRVSSYGQNEPGAKTVPPASETFATLPMPMPQEHETPKAKRFLFTLRDIFAMPDREPIVEDVLNEAEHVTWSGNPKAGKSALALDLGCSLATGQKFVRMKNVLLPGAVAYLSSEGESTFKPRLAAWAKAHVFDDLQTFIDTVPFYFRPDVPRAADVKEHADNIEAYVSGIEADMKGSPHKLRLIVIDTKIDAMLGLDENDASHTQYYIHMIREIIKRLGCAVLTIQHQGNDPTKFGRGSTATWGGVDSGWLVQGDGDKAPISLVSIGGKSVEPGITLSLVKKSILVDLGKGPVKSLIIEPLAKRDAAIMNEPDGDKWQNLRRWIVRTIRASEAYDEDRGLTIEHLSLSMMLSHPAIKEMKEDSQQHRSELGKLRHDLYEGVRVRAKRLKDGTVKDYAPRLEGLFADHYNPDRPRDKPVKKFWLPALETLDPMPLDDLKEED